MIIPKIGVNDADLYHTSNTKNERTSGLVHGLFDTKIYINIRKCNLKSKHTPYKLYTIHIAIK